MKIVCLATFTAAALFPIDHRSETIITPDFLERVLATQRDSMPSTDLFVQKKCIAEDSCMEFTFSVTSKGNGILEFPGGWIRIYDMHQDEEETPPGLMVNELRDVNGDGFKDIVTEIVTFPFDPETKCFNPPTDPIVPVLFSRAPCVANDT